MPLRVVATVARVPRARAVIETRARVHPARDSRRSPPRVAAPERGMRRNGDAATNARAGASDRGGRRDPRLGVAGVNVRSGSVTASGASATMPVDARLSRDAPARDASTSGRSARFVVTSFSPSARLKFFRARPFRSANAKTRALCRAEIAARRARSPACLRDEALASGAPGGRARRRRVGRGVVQVERWGRPSAHGIGGRVRAIVARHRRRSGDGPRVPGCVRRDGHVAAFSFGSPRRDRDGR